jgi:MFS transporter, OFA family, oxalate/formate antiporter
MKAGISREIYYGWYVVAALFFAGMMVYGGGLYAFTVFIPALTSEFGWNRATTGGLVSIFWLTAPLTVFGSYLAVRLGSYRVTAAGIVLAALCMMAIGLANSVVVIFALRALMGFAKILMACGVNVMAAIWFRRRFGLAIAICYAGWHFGGLVLAPLAQYLIDTVGWRHTSFIMGSLICLIGLPPLVAWARKTSPAALGFGLDGDALLQDSESGTRPWQAAAINDRSSSTTFPQATFWLAVAVTVLGGIAYGGLLTHEVALINDRMSAHPIAALSLGLTAGAAIVGAVVVGQLSDRWPYRRTMTLELTMMIAGVCGFLLSLQTSQTAIVLASAVVFGIAVGGFDTCVVSHLRRQLETQAFSRAYGLWYFFYLATLFSGPILIGTLYDAFGSYRFGLYLMIACIGGAMAAVAATPAGAKAKVHAGAA